jgi:hypothetical protein
MWWLPQISGTHIQDSRQFKSIYTMQGKTRSPRHTLFHARFAYGSKPYISCGPRRQPFASPHKDETSSYIRREVLAIEDRLARLSSWITSFPLPHDSLGVGDRGFSQVVIQLHQLIGPITPAYDRYVQYLLMRTNPSVLNRHRRGLQPWRCQLTTLHSPTFPT